MEWIIKFFVFIKSQWRAFFLEDVWDELERVMQSKQAEKIFAEIDNDLIRQIEKAEKDFKQAQLRHIPCRILYYDKHIVKLQIKKIKSFLIKRNRIIRGSSIRFANGYEIHSRDYH